MKKNSFWQTKEGVSALKLIAWLVFIGVIILVFAVMGGSKDKESGFFSSNNDTNTNNQSVVEETNTFDTYEDMIVLLLNKNFSYKYEITSNENQYIFTGEIKDNIDTGYKESKDEIIKYIKKEDKVYKNNLDIEEEITNLYENIDINFIEVDLIFPKLKDIPYEENIDGEKRTITYKTEECSVVVKTNYKYITNISISLEDGSIYNLEFTNIS